MSPPLLRGMNAKVEGRDPPEEAKTMGLFKTLTRRLLKVPMSEVEDQARIYEESRKRMDGLPSKAAKRPKLKIVPASPKGTYTRKDQSR